MQTARAIALRILPARVRPALEGALGRARARWYRGDAVECPCCGGRFRRFLPFGAHKSGAPRSRARCPGCGSMERHRLLWLFLRERTDLLDVPHRLLHLAPEPVFHRRLSVLPGLDYVTADLDSPLARDRVDVAELPYADDAFDAILCNHVLEHVPDDRRAMRELHRVLRPGGWAILQVPIQSGRATTYEDPTVTDPAERRRAFGQEDHLRIYGRDYEERLTEAGFRVRRDRFVRDLPEAQVTRMGLKREDVFFCEKAGASGA